MSTKKLERVLRYVTEGESAKADALLKEYIIEQARKIHESMECELDEDIGGDQEDGLASEIGDMQDENEFEETMTEGEDDDMSAAGAEEDLAGDMEMDGDEDAMMGDEEGAVEDDLGAAEADGAAGGDLDVSDPNEHEEDHEDMHAELQELEDAIAELESEFAEMRGGDEGGGMEGDLDSDMGDDELGAEGDVDGLDMAGDDDMGDEGGDDFGGDDMGGDDFDEKKFEEALEEALELHKVSVPTGKEVGAGTYLGSELNTKSIVASQAGNVGNGRAKPVATGKNSGNANGYNRPEAGSHTTSPALVNQKPTNSLKLKDQAVKKPAEPTGSVNNRSTLPRQKN